MVIRQILKITGLCPRGEAVPSHRPPRFLDGGAVERILKSKTAKSQRGCKSQTPYRFAVGAPSKKLPRVVGRQP